MAISTRFHVRLSVPRADGPLQWAAVSGTFERQLSEQEGPAIVGPHIESVTRRGRDYVRVAIEMWVVAPDVAAALDAAWRAFTKAAAGDTAGWDTASATAEVRPGAPS